MKNLILSVITLFLLSCQQPERTQRAESDLKTAADTVKPNTPQESKPLDPIADIRKTVEAINTGKLQQKHFEFMCDEKTTVDYFYQDTELVKLVIDFGTVGDVYAREDYYFKDGKLVFAYEFVEGGPACDDCIKTDEYRSYIKDDQVIKYMKNKKVESCKKCEFKSSSKPYTLLHLSTAEEIKAVLCR